MLKWIQNQNLVILRILLWCFFWLFPHHSTVGLLYPWVLHSWIQPTRDGKYSEKKWMILSLMNMHRIFCHYSLSNTICNYLGSIYIVLGIISYLEMIYMGRYVSVICKYYGYFLSGTWASMDSGIRRGSYDQSPTDTEEWQSVNFVILFMRRLSQKSSILYYTNMDWVWWLVSVIPAL